MEMKINWTKERFFKVFGKGGQQMIDDGYKTLEGELSKDKILRDIMHGLDTSLPYEDIDDYYLIEYDFEKIA